LLVFSCRKKDIIDNPIVNKAVKETTENVIEKTSKKGAKGLLKEFAIDEKYLKNFQLLDEIQLGNLTIDLSKHKVFRQLFLKNPELVGAYRLTSSNPAVRTEIKYLESITRQLKDNPNKKPVIKILHNLNKENAGKVVNGVPFDKRTIKMDG